MVLFVCLLYLHVTHIYLVSNTLIIFSHDCQSSVGYDAVCECIMWVILPDVKGDSHAVEIQIHHSQSL